MFKYSLSNWIYGDEDLEQTLARLSRYGYDGIELKGEPSQYHVEEVLELCEKYGLRVFSIAGIYTSDRDISHQNDTIRRNALEYLKSCIDFAKKLGADVVVVVPTAVGRVKPCDDSSNWEREFSTAVDSLRQIAPYAEHRGVLLAVEPINRYETFLVRNVDQALELVRRVDSPALGIHLDTFHMNIEERNFREPIFKAGKLLYNVHIADSNRQAVGEGHIDFKEVLTALKEIGYTRTLTLEPLPPVHDPYSILSRSLHKDLWDEIAKKSIENLKSIEKIID